LIERLALVPRLLIASDFDGTLAEIVEDPDLAVPLARSKAALDSLAGLDRTTVAVISGRRRSDLAERFDHPAMILIGEHGADDGSPVDPETPGLSQARRLVDAVVAATPGSRVEHKLRSVGFHYRAVADPEPALETLRREAAAIDGIRVLQAKKIIELTDSPVDKGDALRALRDSLSVDATLFLGDDLTDETAFAVLDGGDLGVHVGEGPTGATLTVPTPSTLAILLETLLTLRAGR
jgi:trehalose 6-phosphate phosphatase